MLWGYVKKFTFKNCGSIFGTYFYDVRNIRYSYVSITEREGSALLRPVFSKYDGSCDRALTTFVQERMKIWGIMRTVMMIRNMLQDGVTPEEEAFLTKEFSRFKKSSRHFRCIYWYER